ncbi:uncharacterized protein LOC130758702 [Actinidia eriantha]|uniref:uncharacterized protein LOC130757959 n=1 Tax=Actinidia eriantha TaxID=165200 RepID=UPI00258C4DF0|nr:uncharacterized protein LOC130757959 [Actinidia eriantha]XP_057469636.1 uncharacterized protein LOC130758702 [Actinidia eriantha]
MSTLDPLNGHRNTTLNEAHDTPFSPTIRQFCRHIPSFSSSPSLSSNSSMGSSSFLEDYPLFSPSTPLRSLGIPFSWEKLPGIPKRQLSKKKEPSLKSLLPLPPAGTPISTKKMTDSLGKRDPFFAAFVECSKDDDDDDQDTMGAFFKGSKVTRTLSDRFGFINMYTSCQRACPVSKSIIYIPRSQNPVASRQRPAKSY